MPAGIEHAEQRAKEGERRAIEPLGIKQIQAQARIKLIGQFEKPVDLGQPDVQRQTVIIAGAMGAVLYLLWGSNLMAIF